MCANEKEQPNALLNVRHGEHGVVELIDGRERLHGSAVRGESADLSDL